MIMENFLSILITKFSLSQKKSSFSDYIFSFCNMCHFPLFFLHQKDYHGFVCHLIDDMTFPFHLTSPFFCLCRQIYSHVHVWMNRVHEIVIKSSKPCNELHAEEVYIFTSLQSHFASVISTREKETISALNPPVNPPIQPKIMCRKLKPSSCNPRARCSQYNLLSYCMLIVFCLPQIRTCRYPSMEIALST